MTHRFVCILICGCALSCAQHHVSFAQQRASFPKIDWATQQARDHDRRHILETELEAELHQLAKAQAGLEAGATQEQVENVHRHLENARALQRELDGVPGRQRTPRVPARATAKAERAATPAPRSTKGIPAYWNPYNRSNDPEVTADSSTTQRRESP